MSAAALDWRKPLAVLAAALLVAGCEARGNETDGKEGLGRPVLVSLVTYQTIAPKHAFVATIRPRLESDLGFRVAGRVAERLVNVGDIVVAGTPLANLDRTDLQLQVEQAQAELAAARAAAVEADADMIRTAGLADRGWMPRVALGRQRAKTEETHSRLLRADRTLGLARNALGYATLVADVPGVVTATSVEPGQVVAPGSVAIRVAPAGAREAVVALPEVLAGRALGEKAELVLWADPIHVYHAKLRELAPVADLTTRTFLARFAIQDADPGLRLGMTATLTLSDTSSERLARVPASALFDPGTQPGVWVVGNGGKLVFKPVRVSRYDGTDVLIGAGVAEGDRVVRLGVQKLDAAQRVNVVDTLGS